MFIANRDRLLKAGIRSRRRPGIIVNCQLMITAQARRNNINIRGAASEASGNGNAGALSRENFPDL